MQRKSFWLEMKRVPTAGACLFLATMLYAGKVRACTVAAEISNVEMVNKAEVIVRATAVKYASPPADPHVWTTGEPDSTIQFQVSEVIRGPMMKELILHGYLVNRDDFNDHESPYKFVRPGGRSGSCFANSYRSGGQFLLFLKKTGSGEFTTDWYALGPVNEQLRSDNDPWLLWVREQARKTENAPK